MKRANNNPESKIKPNNDLKYQIAFYRSQLPAFIKNKEIAMAMGVSIASYYQIAATLKADKYEATYESLRRFVEFYNQHATAKITMEDLSITEPALQ